MYKRLRKEYNAFSLERCRYLYLPTAVVASSHGRGEILPQPWKDHVTAVKN